MTTLKEIDERIKKQEDEDTEFETWGEEQSRYYVRDILKEWRADKVATIEAIIKDINWHQKECNCNKEECLEALKTVLKKQLGGEDKT